MKRPQDDLVGAFRFRGRKLDDKPKAKRAARGAALKPTPDFRKALAADFQANGDVAVARLREDDPIAYLRLCGDMLDGGAPREADDDALIARVRALLAELGSVDAR